MKSSKIEVMDLLTESGEYFIKGHKYNESEIIDELKNHIRKQFNIDEIKESWGHWCWGYFNDCIPTHNMLMDDKYKGVRGGFPITFVRVSFIENKVMVKGK